MNIKIRQAQASDVKTMYDLFLENTGREVDLENLENILTYHPSAIVFDDAVIVGFAKTKPFAPDILELENIFMIEEYRNANIGSKILEIIEDQTKKSPYKSIILNNSNLYKNNDSKRNASSFYLKNGYKEIVSTNSTRIFYKEIL